MNIMFENFHERMGGNVRYRTFSPASPGKEEGRWQKALIAARHGRGRRFTAR
jgi:hypothetical protein